MIKIHVGITWILRLSLVADPAIPGASGSRGVSELQLEAVRLLCEDQVSPVPTTPLCPRPKSTIETFKLAI